MDSHTAPPSTTGPAARPRGEFGVVDWEQFFEHPTNGLVTLIGHARSRDVLRKCSTVIVEGLFTRKDDSLHRQAFLRAISDIVENETDVEGAKSLLVDLLRQVKEYRRTRAEEFVNRKQMEAREAAAAQAAAQAAAERRAAETLATQQLLSKAAADTLEFDTPAPHTDLPPDEPGLAADPRRLFCRAFREVVDERLEILRRGARSPEAIRRPVPFLVSQAFADKLGRIVETEIACDLAEKVNSIIRPAADMPETARHAYLRDQIDEYKNRRALWAAWQDVWKAATRQAEIPPEPEEERKGALDFLKKKDKVPVWKRKMTHEEWEAAVAAITAANQRAARIWAELTARSPDYEAPTDEDNEFLMELFGHSPQAISQHIQALRQIGQQGGEVGRTFDNYRKNKNMDLPLFGACYWYPDVFLGGKKPLLKAMVSGYAKQDLPKALPYTLRFLGHYID